MWRAQTSPLFYCVKLEHCLVPASSAGLSFPSLIEVVHALQRSEVLDKATCNFCISVDSRVIEKEDPFGQNTVFHSNCRGI
jgi:hypothetical protein